MTLYQRLLGEDFHRLPPVLQRFHSLTKTGRGEGIFAVASGRSIIHRALAKLLHLPRNGENVKTTLQVRIDEKREVWRRQFGETVFETVQWEEKGLLIEKSGPMQFALRLHGDESGMRFAFNHAKLFGIRLPRFISMHVDTIVRGDEDCWHVEVTISAPLLGTLMSYRGTITPEL